MKVYLCGPINDVTEWGASNWRNVATKQLGIKNILNPMRRNGENGFQSERELITLDKVDIDNSQILLVYSEIPSVGTSMEVFYAWERNKIIVTVVPDETKISPWLKYHSTVLFSNNDIQKGIDYIKKIMREK